MLLRGQFFPEILITVQYMSHGIRDLISESHRFFTSSLQFASKSQIEIVQFHIKLICLIAVFTIIKIGVFFYLNGFVITYVMAGDYVYNEWSARARTKVARRKHTIQPTGHSAHSSTCP